MDTKRYSEAVEYLSVAIDKDKNNPYAEYLYGLRATTLEKLGMAKEAEEDLIKIEYSPEAY